jgi:hypothetical protein
MIGKYEHYHGAVLRELIVRSPGPLLIEKFDEAGRVNTYLLNGRTGLHIKHSSKRLPPWQFTFNRENLSELDNLIAAHPTSWLALVCGVDGVVSMNMAEFQALTNPTSDAARFIRVDRDRNTMYRVFGNERKLQNAKARGVSGIISDAFRSGQ